MLDRPTSIFQSNSAWRWLLAALQDSPPPDVALDQKELNALLAQHHLHCHFNRWVLKSKDTSLMGALSKSHYEALHFWKRRSLANRAVVAELHETFSAAHISGLLLKGIGLSQRLYEDYSERETNDVDVMVDPQQVEEAHTAIINRGYRPMFDPTLLPVHRKTIRRLFKDLVYLHPTWGIKLEPHWRLDSNEKLLNLKFADLWAQRRTEEVGSLPLATLGDRHNLLYIALHGTRHYWSRLQWLTDFSTLIAVSDLNWNQLLQEARKTGSLRSLVLGCVLRELYCAAPVLSPGGAQLNRASVIAHARYCIEYLTLNRHPRTLSALLSRFFYVLNLAPEISYKFSVIKLLLSDGYETSLGERSPLSMGAIRYVVNPINLVQRLGRLIGSST